MKRWWVLLALLSLAACSKEDPVQRVFERISFSPAQLDFGDVPVGGARQMRLEVQNGGQGPVTLHADGVELPFEIEPTAITVRPDEIGVLNVRFRPRTEAEVEDALRFVTGGSNRFSVPVRGRGVERVLIVEPATVQFGELRVGQSATRNFVVRSVADGQLDLRFRQHGAPNFEVTTDEIVIPGGGEITIEVGFRPTAIGDYSGWLEISPCADCYPVEVHFRGTSTAPTMDLQPQLVEFGRIPPEFVLRRRASVYNGGTTSGEILSVEVESQDDAFVLAASQEFPFDLLPGHLFEFEIEFRPPDPGTYEGWLRVETSEGVLRSALRGTSGGPQLEVAPDVLDFGHVPRGLPLRKTIQIENVGDAGSVDLQVSLDDPQDAFRIVSAPQPGSGPWLVEVELRASDDGGEKDGTLVIRSNLAGQPKWEIPLRGRVIDTACDLVFDPPAPFYLGLEDRAVESEFTVRVSHRGSEPCLVWGPRVTHPLFEVSAPHAASPFVRLEGDESWEVRIRRKAQVGIASELVETTFLLSHTRFGVDARLDLTVYLVSPLPMQVTVPDEITAPMGRARLVRVDVQSPYVVRGKIVGEPAFVVLPNDLPVGSMDRVDLPLLFAPERVGPHPAWLELYTDVYDHPMRIRLEGHGLASCPAPCNWPSLSCRCEHTSGLVTCSGPASPEGVQCAWGAIWLDASEMPLHSNWFGLSCSGGTTPVGWFGQTFVDFVGLAFEGDKAALCRVRDP